MNLTIALTEEQAAALKSQAEAQGLTVESLLQRIAEQHAPSRSIAHLQKTDPKEWARRFDAWMNSHDPNTPVLSEQAMNRESVYPDRA